MIKIFIILGILMFSSISYGAEAVDPQLAKIEEIKQSLKQQITIAELSFENAQLKLKLLEQEQKAVLERKKAKE